LGISALNLRRLVSIVRLLDAGAQGNYPIFDTTSRERRFLSS